MPITSNPASLRPKHLSYGKESSGHPKSQPTKNPTSSSLPGEPPHRPSGRSTSILTIVILVIIIALIGFAVLRNGDLLHKTTATPTPIPTMTPSPTSIPPLMSWDFEDCDVDQWGIYKGGTEQVDYSSHNVTASRGQKNALGNCSLMIKNIGAPASGQERNIQPAVHYQQDFSNTTLTAQVYIPEKANYETAEAVFFLIDNGWHWWQSKAYELYQGEWTTLTWTVNVVPPPSSWKGIIGIQVHIKGGTFTGPVYIDNVTLSQPNTGN